MMSGVASYSADDPDPLEEPGEVLQSSRVLLANSGYLVYLVFSRSGHGYHAHEVIQGGRGDPKMRSIMDWLVGGWWWCGGWL